MSAWPSSTTAERISCGLGDRHDHNYRADIFKKFPYVIANALARRYVDKWHTAGRREANLSILGYAGKRETPHHRLVKLALSDERISIMAKGCARRCQTIALTCRSNKSAYERQARYVTDNGLTPPKVEKYTTYLSASRRMTCEGWWKRQLRKHSKRRFEEMAVQLAMVHKRASIYISESIFDVIRQQNQRNLATLATLEVVNELGDSFSLDEIAEHSLANPHVRRCEVMARIAGFDTVAEETGHEAVFITLTCPSRYHAVLSESGKQNPRYAGYTPKQGQAYLEKVWQRIRAKLNRDNIRIYGFRIAEPHHDATPHWHLLLFTEPGNLTPLISTMRHYALQDTPDEPGAQQRRLKVEKIDRSKGSAAAYVAKYISKSIDGYGMDDDLYGKDAKQTAPRVVAWARVWGIRQFQQIGGPPVGVWRELRRLGKRPAGVAGEAYDAADSGDWATFVKVMGGPFVARKDIRVKLAKLSSADLLTGEIVRLNQYEEPASDQVCGVEAEGVITATRIHEWRIQAKPVGNEGGVIEPVDPDARTCTYTSDRYLRLRDEIPLRNVYGEGGFVNVTESGGVISKTGNFENPV